MRKVLSFVLVLSLVLGSFGMAFAAETTTPVKKTLTDIDGLACEDAVRVLTSLDVVSGYEDGTYKPEQTVTRAEMASLIIKALGLKQTDAVPKFADSKTHWAKGYIAYANTLGIISGRSETVFDPDATVTYDEATTMLIKALGYTDEALNGTYPASFVSRAKVLGILDGIQTGTAGANRGDVAIMLYQTLDQAIGKVDKDGNFVATVIEWEKNGGNATQAKKYDTMLDRLGAEMYEAKNAYKKTEVDDEAFVITAEEDALINLTPYRGAVVSAYANSDDEIIAIKEVFTTFVAGTFGDDNFDTDTVFTLADGTEYTMKSDALLDLKEDIIEFLNGDEKTVGTIAKETQYTLAVELSGKKITDIHSVLKWDIKNGDMVDADDISDIKTNNKLLGVSFPEDNNGDIDLDAFELIGVDSLDKIEKDDVVYVYANDDEEIARVAVGQNTVKGEVTKMNSSRSKITIDGTQYKYASNELKNNRISSDAVLDTKVDTGDEIEIYLDAYGYIYDYDEISGQADNYAVVLKTEDKEDNKISSSAKIKLFLADGTNKVFEVDEDEILDGGIIGSDDKEAVTTSALNPTPGAWNTNTIKPGTLIKYGVDKSGVITDIRAQASVPGGNTGVANVTDNAIDVIDNMAASKKANITEKGYYDGASIASDAVIFNFDGDNFVLGSDMDDADDYGVASYEKILDKDDVRALYVYDNDDKEIVAMVVFDVTSSDDIYGVVVGSGKNNSDAGAYFDMLIDGAGVNKNGDKSDVGRNKYKDLSLIKYDTDGDVKSFTSWSAGTGFATGDKQIRAELTTVDTAKKPTLNNRTFSYNDPLSYTTAGAVTSIPNSITIDRDAYIYVWDRVDEEWQLGSTSDLRNLKDGSKVIFYDVQDEDGIYDIILIDETGTSGSTPTPAPSSKEITVTTTGAFNCTGATITLPSGASFVKSVMTFNGVQLANADYDLSASYVLKLTETGLTKTGIAVGQSGTITVVFDNDAKITVKVNHI
ncbi:S-layer homology domain-containing protein [Bacilliculturomica massiliensis]|uniref:S-layer homology domain-containing protein n=1 Tax=Bacilliculturomica massiliensis TaxID=1917867 RepID=UPI0010323131|nr:S-layer homology domain-containing protein [Bacilliculturomica massiliensis]